MKDAPFNITTVLLAVLGVGLIAGGILGAILSAMGITGFLGIFLAGFLPIPLGSFIRQGVARSAASLEGAAGKSPMAFSLPVRLGVGAIIAAIIAYLFSLSAFYSFGAMMGAIAGLLVQTLLIVVFYVAVAARK